VAECPQCGSPPAPGRLTCSECGGSIPGWELAKSVYATGERSDRATDRARGDGATAEARRPALAFEKQTGSTRALVAAPPAELPPGGPTFAGTDPVAPPVATPTGDPTRGLPPGVRVPLWTPADAAPPIARRADAVIPWRKLCTLIVLVALAVGGYQAYPRARAWWVERAVPADLHAYVEGTAVAFAAKPQGYSVRLPKAPAQVDMPLGPQPAPWTAIHLAVVTGADYRIAIRVGELRDGATLPFGLGGALADPRLGGNPSPHDVHLVAFDAKPAYAFRVSGVRPIAGRVFRRGTRVYVVIVQAQGAGPVLDAVLRSFKLDGE
jgi:hypothetical protein